MENDQFGGGALDKFAATQGGLNQLQFYPNQQSCPHCGYCPHCGRGGHNTLPYYNGPYYQTIYWPPDYYHQPFGRGGGIGQPFITGQWSNA